MAEGTAHEGKIRRVKRILYPLVKIIAYAGSSAEGYPKEIKIFFFLFLIDKSEFEGVLNMKFPFYDAPNTATITCCHILENGEPILYVSHDEDDGMWQFLCGKAHETDEAKLVSLKSVFDLDNSVGILKDMPCGYYAERKAQDDEWSVRKR